MLVSQLNENVFEARSERANLAHGDAVLQKLLAKFVQIEVVFDECVDGLSENGGAADPRNLAREAKRACDFGSCDFHAHGSMRLDVRQFAQRIGCSIGNELAVINVSNVAASLGFVHVVRGYEKSDAVPGKFKKEIP